MPTQSGKVRSGWIYAYRRVGAYPPDRVTSGKWLIWLRLENIDRYWLKIREAVRQGRLGDAAKVSTKRGSRHKQAEGLHMICVYTYNSEDVEDVRRIRQVLYALGRRKPIPYKRDLDTSLGLYGREFHPAYKV